MSEKTENKQGETFETFEITELSDGALDDIVGGIQKVTVTVKYICDACSAVMVSQDAVMEHGPSMNHYKYHVTYTT